MSFKKQDRKKLLSLIISIFLFIFCNNINNSFFVINQNNESTDNFNSDYKNLKLANGWPKIHIDNNWSATASIYDWCTGSGAWDDPYIIKDLVIDSGGIGSSILIENSIEYFIIKNCTLINSGSDWLDAGISLNSVSNGKLTDNNCSYNHGGGIFFTFSDNNTISENNISNNHFGIYLDESEFNNLSGNVVLNNIQDGIMVCGHNNKIMGNIANNNGYAGIWVFYGDNNIISGNNISKNTEHGIHLEWSGNNTVSDNIMKGCGLFLQGDYHIISTNIIEKDNLVNEKAIYYYLNESGLNSVNFTSKGDPGQIILIGCNDSIISNFNIFNTSTSIALHCCSNNSILDNNVFNNTVHGICLMRSNNNIIFKNNATNNVYGIYLSNCFSNNVSENLVSNNTNKNDIDLFYHPSGIYLSLCDYNSVMRNNISYNEENGITLEGSDHNNISENNALNNLKGIYLSSSNYNDIYRNNLSYNGVAGIEIYYSNYINVSGNLMINCGLRIEGSLWDFIDFTSNAIDTSNKINEKPLYYYVSENNLGPDNFTNAGQIILIACNDSTISGLTISHSTYGLHLFLCKNNQIMNNNFSNNLLAGLKIEECSNITISRNFMNKNGARIWPYNYAGIWVYNSDTNIISGNTIRNNTEYGIHLDGSDNNIVYYNSIYGGARDDGSNNTWDDGFAGNFWDDYTGIDADNNGIGDSNYSISGYMRSNDTRPLMYPTYEDTDGDGLNNYEEYTLGQDGYRTNVTNSDSDYDGLSDYWEWLNATNPWESDTDFDGMPDLWEIVNSLDPLVNDAMADPDFDDLENIYEFRNGTDPQNNDTDGDIFLDGLEVKKHTNPLNRWWYPMPNLAVLEFEAKAVKEGEPFTLNFTIINNGIWRAENVIIMIILELLNLTLYTNIENPIDLEANEIYQALIQCTGVEASGGLVMEIILDPSDFINETYSNQDGSLRINCEGDNLRATELQITGVPTDGGGIDPFWIIIIIISGVAFFAIIGTYIVMRPRFKRRALIKRQIQSAKDDIENFEYNFRSFIKAELQTYYKDKWWQDGIPTYIKNTIETQIKAEKIKIPSKAVDKMDFLDFTHYHPIITEKNNWENIFSKTFSDKTIIEENLEKLRVFKRNLYEGKIVAEEMNNYPLYIHAIRNYFTKGFNVFLSYSTLDAGYFKIDEIVEKLQSYPDIDKVFFWEADSGENIVTFMERTLKMSKVFVLFCSEKSLKSKAVEDEWQAAFQLRKKGLMKIVPVYEKEELIPYLLMPLLNVKFTKDDFDGFIQKLYEEILR